MGVMKADFALGCTKLCQVQFLFFVQHLIHFLFSELTEDQQIKMIGGLARDYGSHSFRKGNVTSLTSNPDGPPIASIFLRAQWQAKFGKAQQQYIFTGVGGDQLSGRLASGLNMMDDTFALLPPHWNPTSPTLSSVELNEVIAGYSSLDSSFQVVVQFLLASVIFHAEWIKNNYPSEHPIFNTRFWTNNYHIKYRHSIISGNFFNEIEGNWRFWSVKKNVSTRKEN